MPAVIDVSTAAETNAADAGLLVYLPDHAVNDLLVMWVVTDAVSPVWTAPSGWTILFSQANNVSTVCAYKIATAGEPVSVTMGASLAETYRGAIISIRDVDVASPFGSPQVYSATSFTGQTTVSLPQITTNRADSLVLLLYGGSLTTPLSVTGTIAHELFATTSTAAGESVGAAWVFQDSVGTTPAISARAYASCDGLRAAVQVCPPSAGATIIPAHTISDDSMFLSPMAQTAAHYDTGAFGTTADTSFGTNFGGITAADGLIGAVANAGINSSRGALYFATASTPTPFSMYGIAADFTSTKNLSGKMLLLHINPYAAQSASLLPGLSSDRGIWVGLRSGVASNFKLWQVMARDSYEVTTNKQPIAIRLDAPAVYESGTLDTSAVAGVSLWISTTSVGAFFNACCLFALGTIVIGGGCSNYPITVKAINNVMSVSKERVASVSACENQLLLFQDVVIGDGGTTKTSLYLNGTSIEFPRQASTENKTAVYHAADNIIGLRYNPGAGDSIVHTNSVVSSPNRFGWGLHASASSSASYNFSGLTVVGAGTVTLNKAITVTQLMLKDYSTLDISGATLSVCTIAGTPAANDSVTLSSTTALTGCTIDVSGVTAGNRWASISNPSAISDCVFTGGGGHALRLTTPGSYSFHKNVFTGFGADTSDGAAILNDSGGEITLNITGGGSTPTIKNGTGATTTVQNAVSIVLTNVVVGSSYYVFETSTPTHVYGAGTAVGATVTIPTSYVSDTNITVRVRSASGATKYKPFSAQADLTTAGVSVYCLQEVDYVA